MNNTFLRQVQLIEKDILDMFVLICKKENLKYYLYGGTVLGAVRHNGFIPWDDDVDVCMPRRDYDRFISIANKYLGDEYELYHYTTKKDYSDYTAKLVSKKIYINSKFENRVVKHDIYIDIFPLDGVPSNKIERFFHYRKLNLYRLELMFHYIDEFDSTKKRKFIYMLVIRFAKITKIGRLFNPIKVCEKIDKQFRSVNYDNSILLGSFLGPLREKEMSSSDNYGEGREILFEGDYYITLNKSEEYLDFTYENYMELPPIEERVPGHHNIVSIEHISSSN